MKTQLSIAILLSLTAACGGGGSSEPSSNEAQPVASDQITTTDLVAPSDFQFLTSREVTFNIEAPSLVGKRAFVSVYTDYFLINGNHPFPKYNSRVFMMPLENNKVELGTKIPNDVKEVIVQIVSDNEEDGIAVNVLSIENNNSVAWRY